MDEFKFLTKDDITDSSAAAAAKNFKNNKPRLNCRSNGFSC